MEVFVDKYWTGAVLFFIFISVYLIVRSFISRKINEKGNFEKEDS